MLLNLLIRYGVESASPYASKHWILVQDSAPKLHFRSEYLQEGYTVEGRLDGNEEEFLCGIQPCEIVPTSDYYSRLEMTAGARLSMPTIAIPFFDRYYALGATDRRRFLRACHWFAVSGQAWNISHSLSFTALVQAIEVLLVVPSDAQRCGECDRTLGIGPTRLFAEFVELYAPDTDPAVRRSLYSKRSSLTHEHTLLFADEGGLSLLSPLGAKEREEHTSLRQIARAVLINWLFGPGNAQVPGVVSRRPESSFKKSVRIEGSS